MSVNAILEPTGHIADRSKFERVWEHIPRGCSFHRRRVERFDAENLVAYSPVEYTIEPLSVFDVSMEDADIVSDVITFIRDEFGGQSQSLRTSRFPSVVEHERCSPQMLVDYLLEVEETFVYGPYMMGLSPPVTSNEDTGDFVHRVLCDPRLGNPANKFCVDKPSFARRINLSLQNQERLCFVLPGFPFKDQNPLRCPSPADHVDFGEIGLLCQMHILSLCFFQSYPFGSDFIVLSDGHLYSSVFGVESSAVERYLAKLRNWRNLLNLQGSVHIVDLEECIERLPDQDLEAFYSLRRRVNAFLLDERSAERHPGLKTALDSLVLGMKRNVNSRDILGGLSWEQKAAILYDGAADGDRLRKVARELGEHAREAAAAYAAMNVALRRYNVVERVFQNAIRSTIHPKSSQVGVPRSGSVYPWNGIGVLEPGAAYPERIKTRPLFELGSLASEWIAGTMSGDVYPSYYRRAK